MIFEGVELNSPKEVIQYLKQKISNDDSWGIKYIELINLAISQHRFSKYKYNTIKSSKDIKTKILNEFNNSVEYSEVHHIIPKCCGGTDDWENIVILYFNETNQEHLLAHQYLWKSTSLFSEQKLKLGAAIFKMSAKCKNSVLTNEDIGRLRSDYSKKKSRENKGINRNPKSIKICYNGVIYSSAKSLEKIKINNEYRPHSTILRWAKYNLYGLSIPGKEPEPIITKVPKIYNGIKIEYKGIVYESSRQLSKIPIDGKYRNHQEILKLARNNELGLKILDNKDLEINKIRSKRSRKSSTTAKNILYNGIVYNTANDLIGVELGDGNKYFSKYKISSFAKYEENGLKYVNSDYLSIKNNRIHSYTDSNGTTRYAIEGKYKILYRDKIFYSARSLENILMFDGKFHCHETILNWAKKKINNLRLIEDEA